MARYPEIRVSVHSSSPLAQVSLVRQAMRQAGIGRDEISRFSFEALSDPDPHRMREVCGRWVAMDRPALQ